MRGCSHDALSRCRGRLRHVAYSITPGSLALSRSVLDRAADRRRDDDWLEKAWAADDTQVVVVSGDKIQVSEDRSGLRFVPPSAAPEGLRIFLGIDRESGAGMTAEGRAVFGVLMKDEADESYGGLRELGAL